MKNNRLSHFKIFITYVWLGVGLSSCSLEDVLDNDSLNGSSLSLNEKVVLGLRTALKLGIDSSSMTASKLNGYFANKAIKILLPEEAMQALEAVKQVGLKIQPLTKELEFLESAVNSNFIVPTSDKNSFVNNLTTSTTLLSSINQLSTLSDSLILYMNRAAEKSAPRSVPIFKNVISEITITSGLNLLNSSDSSAATNYLNAQTFNPLVIAYTPLVDSTLLLVPLTKYWGNFKNSYNSILTKYDELLAFKKSWNSNSFVNAVPALQINSLTPLTYKRIETESLGAYTTTAALNGLFYLVGNEEKTIRRNPLGYIQNLTRELSGIIKEVFADIMKMETK